VALAHSLATDRLNDGQFTRRPGLGKAVAEFCGRRPDSECERDLGYIAGTPLPDARSVVPGVSGDSRSPA